MNSWPTRKTISGRARIGIGGRIAPPPLPHHRTYGSVYGGSIGYAVASRVLGFSPRPGCLGPFRFAPRSFTPLDEREGQLFLPFLPHCTHEIRYLLTTPIVQAFAPSPDLLCPLLTSALRSGCLSAPSVALPRHRTDLLV